MKRLARVFSALVMLARLLTVTALAPPVLTK